MTTALATTRNNVLSVSDWGMIQQIAPVIQKSRLFGVATVEQAMAIMIKGYELGLPFAASFDFITVIGDRPALIPRGALALIQQSSEFSQMKIEDERDDKNMPQRCRVWMKRKNGFEYTATFSIQDAQRADLVQPKSGWTKYPERMMLWRAVGFAAKVVFPDVIGGLNLADELGADLTAEGEVITVEARPVQLAQPQPQLPQTNTATLLNDLVAKFGPVAILQANDNKLPATTEEVEALRVKLENGVIS